MSVESRDDLRRFALAVYAADGVPAACLLLQNRLDLDVNLVLFAAYIGAAHDRSLTETALTIAQERVRDWHSEVVRPLRAVRQRLKNGPSPAPTPATIELRRKLHDLEIESELIELDELDDVAANVGGPTVTGEPAQRAAAGITVVAVAAAERDLDDTELEAVSVIAAAAERVRPLEGR